MNTIDIFTLSDRAITLYFFLRERGAMDLEAIERGTGRSTATVYRALAELTDAGFETGLSRKPPSERIRKTPVRRARKSFFIASESTQLTQAA